MPLWVLFPVLACLGGWGSFQLWRGFTQGRVADFVPFTDPNRATSPISFWMAMAWNGILALAGWGLFIAVVVVTALRAANLGN